MPTKLDDSRVRLADAARNAWSARVNDLRGKTDDHIEDR